MKTVMRLGAWGMALSLIWMVASCGVGLWRAETRRQADDLTNRVARWAGVYEVKERHFAPNQTYYLQAVGEPSDRERRLTYETSKIWLVGDLVQVTAGESVAKLGLIRPDGTPGGYLDGLKVTRYHPSRTGP